MCACVCKSCGSGQSTHPSPTFAHTIFYGWLTKFTLLPSQTGEASSWRTSRTEQLGNIVPTQYGKLINLIELPATEIETNDSPETEAETETESETVTLAYVK